MNAALRAAGIELPLLPMLRLGLETWGALGAVNTMLNLPSYLARSWGKHEIASTELAATWQSVCAAQDELLKHLGALHGPRELLNYLAESTVEIDRTFWAQKRDAYEAARGAVKRLRERADAFTRAAEALRAEALDANREAGRAEQEKGEHWRAHALPLQRRIGDICEAASQRVLQTGKLTKEERAEHAAQERRETEEVEALRAQLRGILAQRPQFDATIAARRDSARALKRSAREKIEARLALERSEESRAARATLQSIEAEAELEKLRRVRDAYLTSHGLRYTALRPTAWWFPLVSPDGAWFHRLVETMTARIEEL
jgi:hypothetical protein